MKAMDKNGDQVISYEGMSAIYGLLHIQDPILLPVMGHCSLSLGRISNLRRKDRNGTICAL